MNIENILNRLSNKTSENQVTSTITSASISSMLPGGLTGGAAAGGLVALLLGSKSTRKMATKVAKFGGTAVLGGLAYKAYDNWQQNKAIGQTQPVLDSDIVQSITKEHQADIAAVTPLSMTLILTMIAASKADGNIDELEHRKLNDSIRKLDLGNEEKAAILDLMSRDISIEEIASSIHSDEHKAEVYLAAYLAIEVDNQAERTFLNNLGIALNLPRGFPAYLEQQADQGIAS